MRITKKFEIIEEMSETRIDKEIIKFRNQIFTAGSIEGFPNGYGISKIFTEMPKSKEQIVR